MLNKTDDTVAIERNPLDTRVPPHVRVINGALDEEPNGEIVLQGRIDPNTLRFLKVDQDYQRPLSERKDIYDALKAGVIVPNIEIGVRGQDFESDGDDYIIKSPAYIIDGWQRVGTALQILEQTPDHPIRIFGSVHFGTEAPDERHRFTELNKNIRRVSPNLHLRNMQDQNIAVAQLHGLSHNQRDFPLYKKVCWGQNMERGDLTTALLVAKTAARLHAHHGGLKSGAAASVAEAIDSIAKKVGTDRFRRNVLVFFKTLDECFGLRHIEYRATAPQLKTSFLMQVARLFSTHIEFWDEDGNVFFVSADYRHKLAKFSFKDPNVRHLASSGGAAGNILYEMLLQHMNSGRRTGHLRSRYAA